MTKKTYSFFINQKIFTLQKLICFFLTLLEIYQIYHINKLSWTIPNSVGKLTEKNCQNIDFKINIIIWLYIFHY